MDIELVPIEDLVEILKLKEDECRSLYLSRLKEKNWFSIVWTIEGIKPCSAIITKLLKELSEKPEAWFGSKGGIFWFHKNTASTETLMRLWEEVFGYSVPMEKIASIGFSQSLDNDKEGVSFE